MSAPLNSTRQKLIQAALELFMAQGVGTPTRKIAELAEVNEVTLFRNFGSKYGLLLAVFEDSEAFQKIGKSLAASVPPFQDDRQVLRAYASSCLHLMRQASQLICSIVGEAEQYPDENRRALGRGLTQMNLQGSRSLASQAVNIQLYPSFKDRETASLLHSLLLGYATIEFATEDHQLWQSQDEFLDRLVDLFMPKAASSQSTASTPDRPVELSSSLVHEILRRTRKLSNCDYALAYVLFAAGLSASEIAGLERADRTSDAHQHLLRAGQAKRSVPVNQWILGKRYGSYTANPLTKYLKSRKDSHPALFLDDASQPITAAEIEARWQSWVEAIASAEKSSGVQEGGHWAIVQAQHTWYIDMLLRGISLENLSILSGLEIEQLKPYAERAKEISALEQATRLDQKSNALPI
jgi:AcrR family transcriptional regulator